MRRHSNPNALIPFSGGVQGQAINRPSQQQPGEQGNEPFIRTFSIAQDYFLCKEYHSFYPCFNYEVVKAKATDLRIPNTPLRGSFHSVNFPIDKLCEHLMIEATELSNIRMITFHNPLLWEELLPNFERIMDMTLRILVHVQPSLTRIVICADILNDKVFHALSLLPSLLEVEILLGTIFFDFPNRLAQIGEELNRGITRLSKVEYFKIPLELITGALLSCLGRLPSLHFLKITGFANAPYPGRFVIECSMNYFHIQTPTFFGSLRLLDVRGDLLEEDFFSREILAKIFPNTKFIKA